MLRNIIVGLAAALLVGVAFIPDDALAYRGGGARAAEGLARQLSGVVLLALLAVAWPIAGLRIAERPIAERPIVAGILIAERRSVPQQWERRQSVPLLTAATTTTVTVTTATAVATKTPTEEGSASNISVGRGAPD